MTVYTTSGTAIEGEQVLAGGGITPNTLAYLRINAGPPFTTPRWGFFYLTFPAGSPTVQYILLGRPITGDGIAIPISSNLLLGATSIGAIANWNFGGHDWTFTWEGP